MVSPFRLPRDASSRYRRSAANRWLFYMFPIKLEAAFDRVQVDSPRVSISCFRTRTRRLEMSRPSRSRCIPLLSWYFETCVDGFWFRSELTNRSLETSHKWRSACFLPLKDDKQDFSLSESSGTKWNWNSDSACRREMAIHLANQKIWKAGCRLLRSEHERNRGLIYAADTR